MFLTLGDPVDDDGVGVNGDAHADTYACADDGDVGGAGACTDEDAACTDDADSSC